MLPRCCLPAVTAIVLLCSMKASAVEVKNLTQGTTLFYDNFEGVVPALGVPNAPVPLLGRWTNENRVTSVGIETIPSGDPNDLITRPGMRDVVSAGTERSMNPGKVGITDSMGNPLPENDPAPGPFSGDNYLYLNRTRADFRMWTDIGDAAAQAQHVGDVIQLEYMQYIPSSTNRNPYDVSGYRATYFPPGPGQALDLLLQTEIDAASNQIREATAGSATDMIGFERDQWQSIRFRYVVDDGPDPTGAWSVSVDGGAFVSNPSGFDYNAQAARPATLVDVLAAYAFRGFGNGVNQFDTLSDVYIDAAWDVQPGDTDFNRVVDQFDLQNILGANKLNAGPSAAKWGEGDFDFDRDVDQFDLQAVLGTNLLNAGPYAAASHAIPGDGLVDLFVNANGTAVLNTDGVEVNGFILASPGGYLSGAANTPTSLFEPQNDAHILGVNFITPTLTGQFNLGSLVTNVNAFIGELSEVGFTYTVRGQAGIFNGNVTVVPEPTCFALFGFSLALAAVAGHRRDKRVYSRK